MQDTMKVRIIVTEGFQREDTFYKFGEEVVLPYLEGVFFVRLSWAEDVEGLYTKDSPIPTEPVLDQPQL